MSISHIFQYGKVPCYFSSMISSMYRLWLQFLPCLICFVNCYVPRKKTMQGHCQGLCFCVILAAGVDIIIWYVSCLQIGQGQRWNDKVLNGWGWACYEQLWYPLCIYIFFYELSALSELHPNMSWVIIRNSSQLKRSLRQSVKYKEANFFHQFFAAVHELCFPKITCTDY